MANTCLLSPIPGRIHNYTAQRGMLKLAIVDVVGTTNLDTVDSSVFDITTPGSHVSVPFTATTTSLSFQMDLGKKYFISLACVQLIDPFSAQGQLQEACGQVLDTISAVNLFPGYFVQEVA